MYKFAALCLLAIVAAAAAHPQSVVEILKSESDINPDGTYHYSFETGDGVRVEQHGESKPIGNEFGNSASGQFSFTSADGEPVSVHYVADENGYQPTGDHIHPIPEAIARSIKWNEEHPEPQKH